MIGAADHSACPSRPACGSGFRRGRPVSGAGDWLADGPRTRVRGWKQATGRPGRRCAVAGAARAMAGPRKRIPLRVLSESILGNGILGESIWPPPSSSARPPPACWFGLRTPAGQHFGLPRKRIARPGASADRVLSRQASPESARFAIRPGRQHTCAYVLFFS